MTNRADELRRRMARRKQRKEDERKKQASFFHEYGGSGLESNEKITYDSFSTPHHPHRFLNREAFTLKLLLSAVLVLLIAIVFRSPSTAFESSRAFIVKVMETEFQFAMIADWYEQQFGSPLAILPSSKEKKDASFTEHAYVLPASGKVLTAFSKDERGILIETGDDAVVGAMKEGTVIFTGQKEELGNTVIIQHPDQSESWYAYLETMAVKQYERVATGEKIGIASYHKKSLAPTFYFAIKQDNRFIDPSKVINFE